MDPNTLLDHAVFQLTPTRTRCDLLVVARNGSREKIASGLLQPFLTHLKSARDQIPKGGYSFSLRVPDANGGNPVWFTRGTVERFVRFVATPEIVERVVTIEKEIVQIEDEIHRCRLSNTEASGENTKVALLLVLENRKTMLQKEQGMAYARAAVAGYNKGHIDDLVSFADAFGASRLREACVGFNELCAEKAKDRLWVEELAALEACRQSPLACLHTSGVVLTSETERNNSVSQEQNVAAVQGDASQTTHQFPMGGWLNPPPEYMYPFYGPMAPNSAPFQGYAFPGMQFMPPYSTPGNSQHHSRNEEYNNVQDGSFHNGHKHSESESVSDDGESLNKNRRQKGSSKKASKKVVIRNINYISSKGRHAENDSSEESSEDEDSVDEDFLRRKVEDIVGSFEKHQNSNRHNKSKSERRKRGIANGSSDTVDKNMESDADTCKDKRSNESWDAFQNILMKDESEMDQEKTVSAYKNDQKMDIVDEYCTIKTNGLTNSSSCGYHQLEQELERGTKQKILQDDLMVVNGQVIVSEGGSHVENFECDDTYYKSIKRVQNSSDEFLLTQRENSEVNIPGNFTNSIDESSAIKSHREGDWFIVNEYGRNPQRESGESLNFETEHILRSEDYDLHKENKKEDYAVDDSVVVPERSQVDQQSFSMWETEMNIISGVPGATGAHDTLNHSNGDGGSDFHEPDDLQMMLGRDPGFEYVAASWTPEVDYTVNVTHSNVSEQNSSVEPDNVINDKLPPKNKSQGNTNEKLSDNDKKSKLVRGYLPKSKSDVSSRSRKLSNMSKEAIQMTKAQQEEANRKRLEELMIERQKRIHERSAARSKTAPSTQTKPDTKVPPKKTLGMDKLQISQKSKQNGTSQAMKLQHPIGRKV